MNDKFEWITDHDKAWSDSLPPKSSTADHKRRNRLLLVVGLLLVALLLTGLILLNALEKRVEETSSSIEEEVKDAQLLLLEAAVKSDYELLNSLLPEKDLKWREAVLQQMDTHLLINRRPLGLQLVDQRVSSNLPITVTLSPDLTRAEVSSLLPFRVIGEEEADIIVNLESSTAFSREEGRWVTAVPVEDSKFWGAWEHITIDELKITVPFRDVEFARQMIDPLSKLIDDICASDQIRCPRNYQVELHLDHEPEAINRLHYSSNSRGLININSRYYLPLPTPTLVGRPIDDAGLTALYRGYANILATALITNFARFQGSESSQQVLQLLDRYGLVPPPAPLAVLPRPRKTLNQESISLPTEDVLLMCSNRESTNLLRLDLNGGRWSDEWSSFELPQGLLLDNQRAYITPAPEHRGALVHTNRSDEGIAQWQSYWWRDSDLLLLIDDNEPYEIWPPTFQKDISRIGRFLRVTRDDQSGSVLQLTTSWFDMGQCLAGPCQVQQAVGYPIWSEDGTRTLVISVSEEEGATLFRGDSEAQPLEYLGLGSSPFWISDTTFGFVRPSQVGQDGQIVEDAGEEIVFGQITDTSGGNSLIRSLIDTKFLREVLPEGRKSGPLKILHAAANPHDPDQWILAAASNTNIPAEESTLFNLNIETQELSIIVDLQGEGLLLPVFISPDKGFLAFVTVVDNDTFFYLYDTANGRLTKSSHSFPVDWSHDDGWLLFVERERLILLSAASDSEFEIPINLLNCYSAVFTSED